MAWMKPTHRQASRWPDFVKWLALSLMLCAFWPQVVQAQYKWVGRDGVVHYSDLPPPVGARVLSRGAASEPPGDGRRSPAASASGEATPGADRPIAKATSAASVEAQPALPAALRQAVRAAPVVLYTTGGCAPCDEGRSLLRSRGVPVREQRIETEADLKALQALNIPSGGFPVLMVGGERAIGFEQGQWTRMLDAAQYPATSALPRRWQPEPATNLAGVSGAPTDRTSPADAGAGTTDDAAAQLTASDAALATPSTSTRPATATQSAPAQSGTSRIRF